MNQFDDPWSQYSLNTIDGTLVFLKFLAQDVGVYYCNGTNRYGTAISSNATIQLAGMKWLAIGVAIIILLKMATKYWALHWYKMFTLF